jgi:hypothetical protein
VIRSSRSGTPQVRRTLGGDLRPARLSRVDRPATIPAGDHQFADGLDGGAARKLGIRSRTQLARILLTNGINN